MGIEYLTRDDLIAEITEAMRAPDPDEGWVSVDDFVDAMIAAGITCTRDVIRQRVYRLAANEHWEKVTHGGQVYYRKGKPQE